MATLKEKLAKDIEGGNVKLGSGDVAAFSAPVAEAVQEEVKGDVQVTADIPKNDMVNKSTPASPVLNTATDNVTVTITEEDRNEFITAMVTGNRFKAPSSLFGGRFPIVFRSRSQSESQAIIAQLTRELRAGKLLSDADYGSRLCCMLLAAGVALFNGTENNEFAKPHFAVIGTDGKVGDPGWLEQVAYWEGLDNGLVTAIYEAFKVFEKKYWVMVAKAGDQNFWRLVGSTSV